MNCLGIHLKSSALNFFRFLGKANTGSLMWHFSGFNGFGQFGKEHASNVNRLTNFSLGSLNDEFLITPGWSCNVIAVDKEIFISGFVDSCRKAIDKIQLPEKIIALGSTDNYCLILLTSGKLFKLSRKDLSIKEIKLNNFFSKAFDKPKTVEETKATNMNETVKVEHIACSSNLALAITTDNSVYSIPTKIFQFPESEKIIALQCGFEHAIALNSVGDVYTWGNGLRGQLGIDELIIQEIPALIEALGGIKIVSIAAGGWHSAAVSLIGDIYTWGLNCSGQLGMRVFNANGVKNTTVYPSPQLLDISQCFGCKNKQEPCNITDVYCGARHTIARTSCGTILAAGWNKYGQLGLPNTRSVVDELEQICFYPRSNVNLICGPWCTVLKFNKERHF